MPVNDAALVRRRQDLLRTLRDTTGAALATRWLALPGYTDANKNDWVRVALPVLTAAQSRAVSIQIAHLQALLGSPVRYDRAALLARAAIDLEGPFISLANALANGAAFADAVEAGRVRAEGVGESGVQWASRSANEAVTDDRVVGWTRTITALSCDWCRLVSTQRYHSAESASFGHLRCDCGVDPIIGTRDPGRVVNGELLAALKS